MAVETEKHNKLEKKKAMEVKKDGRSSTTISLLCPIMLLLFFHQNIEGAVVRITRDIFGENVHLKEKEAET